MAEVELRHIEKIYPNAQDGTKKKKHKKGEPEKKKSIWDRIRGK